MVLRRLVGLGVRIVVTSETVYVLVVPSYLCVTLGGDYVWVTEWVGTRTRGVPRPFLGIHLRSSGVRQGKEGWVETGRASPERVRDGSWGTDGCMGCGVCRSGCQSSFVSFPLGRGELGAVFV